MGGGQEFFFSIETGSNYFSLCGLRFLLQLLDSAGRRQRVNEWAWLGSSTTLSPSTDGLTWAIGSDAWSRVYSRDSRLSLFSPSQ